MLFYTLKWLCEKIHSDAKDRTDPKRGRKQINAESKK